MNEINSYIEKKYNILTGASGFLGKSILRYSNISFLTLGRSIKSDIVSNLLYEIPKLSNVNLLVHCAGMAHFIPKNKEQEKLIYDTNITITHNLLSAFSASNLPKKIIFISSVSVYGLFEGEYINESYPLLASDSYGKSKIDAEIMIKKWCDKNNVICTILRLPLIVGKNPPGNLGSMILGIKNGYYFNIAGGNAKKSMVLAEDIAKHLLKVSEIGGTYNLTDGVNPTFKEISIFISLQFGNSLVLNLPYFVALFLAKIGDLIGNKFPINTNKLQKITSTLTFDDTNARINFGWNPRPVIGNFKI